MMPHAWCREAPGSVLISRHRDNNVITRAISWFGIKNIRGSTSKKGIHAVYKILNALHLGESIGITPDGPRGPRMQVHGNVLSIAKLAGVPIIPCAYGTSRRKTLKSWDRFIVPLPFSRGIFVYGDAISVPRHIDKTGMEKITQTLTQDLNNITREADHYCGILDADSNK